MGTHDKIIGLEGVAGAGKTTSLTAVREAAERERYHVVGLAPTSRAAHKLAESGIESHTLQRQLIRNEAPHEGQKRLFVTEPPRKPVRWHQCARHEVLTRQPWRPKWSILD